MVISPAPRPYQVVVGLRPSGRRWRWPRGPVRRGVEQLAADVVHLHGHDVGEGAHRGADRTRVRREADLRLGPQGEGGLAGG